jgi:hypothetical protein
MTTREEEEYRALRATIRERGTARSWTFVVGLSVWAGLALAVLALASVPAAALLPLLVLAGTFEAVFALHVSVERIGRYIQVFYEEDEDGSGKWEHTSMAFGRPLAGTGADPLFTILFGLATLFNFVMGVSAGATGVELGVTGAAHALVLARIVIAGRLASRQRPADLERLQRIKSMAAQPLPHSTP